MTKQRITFETLVAMAAGELSPEEAQPVHEALEAEPALQARLRWIEQVLATMRADDSAEPSAELVAKTLAIFEKPEASDTEPVWKRAIDAVDQFIATLLFDSRAEPALAGYRGVGDVVRLAYQLDGSTELELEVSEDSQLGQPVFNLVGQLTGDGAYQGVQVDVVGKGGAMIAQVKVDGSNMFECTLPGGTVDLIIHIGEQAVRVPGLTLGA